MLESNQHLLPVIDRMCTMTKHSFHVGIYSSRLPGLIRDVSSIITYGDEHMAFISHHNNHSNAVKELVIKFPTTNSVSKQGSDTGGGSATLCLLCRTLAHRLGTFSLSLFKPAWLLHLMRTR